MEKRFYWGLGILPLFLALGLLVSYAITQIQQPIAASFSQAAQAAVEGDLETGIALADQAKQRWLRYRAVVASVADHSQLDSIEQLLGEAQIFAETWDAEHFAACCAQLAQLTQALANGHIPLLENVL